VQRQDFHGQARARKSDQKRMGKETSGGEKQEITVKENGVKKAKGR